jgi:hypothetical protein
MVAVGGMMISRAAHPQPEARDHRRLIRAAIVLVGAVAAVAARHHLPLGDAADLISAAYLGAVLIWRSRACASLRLTGAA